MFEIKFDGDGFERALNEAIKESIEASVRTAAARVACDQHGEDQLANIRADMRDDQLSISVDWCCPDGEQRMIDAITEELADD